MLMGVCLGWFMAPVLNGAVDWLAGILVRVGGKP